MELNRQVCRLIRVCGTMFGARACRKIGAIPFVQKRRGLMFVSPLDCEGNGHF
jgi:hypothetical protein